MRLLVSVVDAAEARLAVAGGVDVVDVKNPAEGSLGAPAPGVLAAVRRALPAELPLSAALGDLPCLPGTAALAALGAARSGAAYVKLGLWGAATAEDAVAVLRAAREAVEGDAAVVAVAYADAARVPSRPLAPRDLVAVARRAGLSGCLVDTAIKDGRGLLSSLGADALAELVADAHAAGLEIALAGELRAEDLPAVRATGADIAGVRSAACRDGRRTAALDPARIARLRAACAVEAPRATI
jgi:(5-formylfuran-3-yl)methyl phosphate synthase